MYTKNKRPNNPGSSIDAPIQPVLVNSGCCFSNSNGKA